MTVTGCMWTLNTIFVQLHSSCYQLITPSWAWMMTVMTHQNDNQSVHTPTCSIEGIVVVLMVTVGEAAGARPYTRVCIQGFRQLCSLAVYRWQRFCFVADGWRQFLLFLQDTSSNDYAQQARLCSDLAYVYNSFAKVSCIWWHEKIVLTAENSLSWCNTIQWTY